MQERGKTLDLSIFFFSRVVLFPENVSNRGDAKT